MFAAPPTSRRAARETEVAVRRPDAEHVLKAARSARARLDDRSIELAVVGSARRRRSGHGRIRSSPQIAGWEGVQAER